jgi:hypothetical protein
MLLSFSYKQPDLSNIIAVPVQCAKRARSRAPEVTGPEVTEGRISPQRHRAAKPQANRARLRARSQGQEKYHAEAAEERKGEENHHAEAAEERKGEENYHAEAAEERKGEENPSRRGR